MAPDPFPSDWLFTPEHVERDTPSIIDGFDRDLEAVGRAKAVDMVMRVGVNMRLKQEVLATASTYVHRFYMRHSLLDHHTFVAALAALFIAFKSEDAHHRLKSLVEVGLARLHKDKDNAARLRRLQNEGERYSQQVLDCENKMVRSLAFDLIVQNPYAFVARAADALGLGPLGKDAVWGWVNDSQRSTNCLIHPPNVIAAAATVLGSATCSPELDFTLSRLDWASSEWMGTFRLKGPEEEVRKAVGDAVSRIFHIIAVTAKYAPSAKPEATARLAKPTIKTRIELVLEHFPSALPIPDFAPPPLRPEIKPSHSEADMEIDPPNGERTPGARSLGAKTPKADGRATGKTSGYPSSKTPGYALAKTPGSEPHARPTSGGPWPEPAKGGRVDSTPSGRGASAPTPAATVSTGPTPGRLEGGHPGSDDAEMEMSDDEVLLNPRQQSAPPIDQPPPPPLPPSAPALPAPAAPPPFPPAVHAPLLNLSQHPSLPARPHPPTQLEPTAGPPQPMRSPDKRGRSPGPPANRGARKRSRSPSDHGRRSRSPPKPPSHLPPPHHGLPPRPVSPLQPPTSSHARLSPSKARAPQDGKQKSKSRSRSPLVGRRDYDAERRQAQYEEREAAIEQERREYKHPRENDRDVPGEYDRRRGRSPSGRDRDAYGRSEDRDGSRRRYSREHSRHRSDYPERHHDHGDRRHDHGDRRHDDRRDGSDRQHRASKYSDRRTPPPPPPQRPSVEARRPPLFPQPALDARPPSPPPPRPASPAKQESEPTTKRQRTGKSPLEKGEEPEEGEVEEEGVEQPNVEAPKQDQPMSGVEPAPPVAAAAPGSSTAPSAPDAPAPAPPAPPVQVDRPASPLVQAKRPPTPPVQVDRPPTLLSQATATAAPPELTAPIEPIAPPKPAASVEPAADASKPADDVAGPATAYIEPEVQSGPSHADVTRSPTAPSPPAVQSSPALEPPATRAPTEPAVTAPVRVSGFNDEGDDSELSDDPDAPPSQKQEQEITPTKTKKRGKAQPASTTRQTRSKDVPQPPQTSSLAKSNLPTSPTTSRRSTRVQRKDAETSSTANDTPVAAPKRATCCSSKDEQPSSTGNDTPVSAAKRAMHRSSKDEDAVAEPSLSSAKGSAKGPGKKQTTSVAKGKGKATTETTSTRSRSSSPEKAGGGLGMLLDYASSEAMTEATDDA